MRRDLFAPGLRFAAGTLLLFFLLPACSGAGGESGEAERNEAETMLGLAQRVADNWIQTVRPEQNDWAWGDGVLMFGLSQLASVAPKPEYWDYLGAWMDHHLSQGYTLAFSDHCPPGIAAVRLQERTGDPRYLAVTDRIWDYLQNVAARTSDGGLNHMGFVTGRQLWVDSLFMFGIVLNEMARREDNDAYRQELLDQVRVFSLHLRDEASGLYRHMWDDRTKKVTPEEPLFWARGNAWVFVTLVELLGQLDGNDPRRQEPLDILAAMAESLASWQAPSGLWHTLVNDPDTYEETSASALFAYGFHKGMRVGVLPQGYGNVVERAMAGLRTRLLRGCEGGVIVAGTSHGTSPGDRSYYANVTVGDQVPYGVGAVLLACTEVGDWPASANLPAKEGCPEIPEDPRTPEELVARAVYRLGGADLEGAREDFRRVEALEPQKGEGLFGDAFVDLLFTAFRIYDEFVRFSIEEVSWADFQEVVRAEILPALDGIRGKISLAGKDEGFSLSIPALQINRRGMYTPFLDLSFDARSAADVLVVLNLVGFLLGILT